MPNPLQALIPQLVVHHLPAPAVSDVYDTVGAGDTTIAVLILAIAAGATYLPSGSHRQRRQRAGGAPGGQLHPLPRRTDRRPRRVVGFCC